MGRPGELFSPIGVADETIGVQVDIGRVADRKLRGILAHRTQLIELERFPVEQRWLFLTRECFVRAWPPSHREGGRIAADLFEGILPDPM